MNIKKYILYVGLNDKETKQQKIGIVEAYKVVENILGNFIDGWTIYERKRGV